MDGVAKIQPEGCNRYEGILIRLNAANRRNKWGVPLGLEERSPTKQRTAPDKHTCPSA
jgi:hypothetical protein